MAEIEKDLPDPLETPVASSSTDPDDLVAQLAGDAIDRLLEDAEKGIVPPRPAPEDDPLNELDAPAASTQAPVPAPEVPPDAAPAQSVATGPMPEPTADSDLPPTSVPQASTPPISPAADAATDADEPGDPPADADVPPAMQAELDSLFNSLGDAPDPSATEASKSAPEPVPAPGAPPTPPTEPPESAARAAMPPPVDVPPEIANDDGHGGSLAAAEAEQDRRVDLDNDASLQTDVKQLLDDATHAAPRAAPGFIVVPLRLLNAPFAGLSDETRDTLGQIALVTLVNALAIMLYVILFR